MNPSVMPVVADQAMISESGLAFVNVADPGVLVATRPSMPVNAKGRLAPTGMVVGVVVVPAVTPVVVSGESDDSMV